MMVAIALNASAILLKPLSDKHFNPYFAAGVSEADTVGETFLNTLRVLKLRRSLVEID
jgi:hypothetical protein